MIGVTLFFMSWCDMVCYCLLANISFIGILFEEPHSYYLLYMLLLVCAYRLLQHHKFLTISIWNNQSEYSKKSRTFGCNERIQISNDNIQGAQILNKAIDTELQSSGSWWQHDQRPFPIHWDGFSCACGFARCYIWVWQATLAYWFTQKCMTSCA